MVGMSDAASRAHVLQTAMASVWNRARGEVFARLDLIAQMVAAYASGTPNERLRQEAEDAAHKLAGGLGTFGFAEGSHLARSSERLLALPRLQPEQVRELDRQLRALRREVERPFPPSAAAP